MKNDFRPLYDRAHAAGMAAGTASRPTPMLVTEPSGYAPVTYAPIMDGVCGFAWISIPGNTAFGRWAKKTGVARPDYPKGLAIWVSEFNQSMTRKEAYAHAFAEVLRDAGHEAWTRSRMD